MEFRHYTKGIEINFLIRMLESIFFFDAYIGLVVLSIVHQGLFDTEYTKEIRNCTIYCSSSGGVISVIFVTANNKYLLRI